MIDISSDPAVTVRKVISNVGRFMDICYSKDNVLYVQKVLTIPDIISESQSDVGLNIAGIMDGQSVIILDVIINNTDIFIIYTHDSKLKIKRDTYRNYAKLIANGSFTILSSIS